MPFIHLTPTNMSFHFLCPRNRQTALLHLWVENEAHKWWLAPSHTSEWQSQSESPGVPFFLPSFREPGATQCHQLNCASTNNGQHAVKPRSQEPYITSQSNVRRVLIHSTGLAQSVRSQWGPGRIQNPKAFLHKILRMIVLSWVWLLFLFMKQSTIYSYPNQMYPWRWFSFCDPYSLIKHIGIGPG